MPNTISIVKPYYLLLAAVFLGSLVGCSDDATLQPGAGGAKARPVIAAKVAVSPEQVNVEAVGTSRALHSVAIRSRAAGQVTEVNISPGQSVAEGQVLLRLDDRDEALALRKAEVELADAERLLTRYRQTKGSGAVTESALDDAESMVARAQIAVDRARVNLEYQNVVAPFAGHVGLSDIDPGAWVDTDTVITTIDDRSLLLVTFELPELLLGQIQPEQEIELSTWRTDSVVAQGKVVAIDSRVDESERTFKVRAHVNNSADRLRPGMSFRIGLTLTGNDYYLVPEVSLQWGARGSFVWTIKDGIARRELATIVQRRAGQVLVSGALQKDSLVVLEGIQMVREGQPVKVAEVRELNVKAQSSESSAANEASVSSVVPASARDGEVSGE
ncbi:efflux RND transporter periplasmic adaptor subunit [Gilvimarinus agarilyticus]|uniref:efflux RND transporter periplasmic adaptor subunit n=1 Tax=Gilvimarinus agarilyticus TaxID=679259 RepID=UPI000699000E|nr:efflux RND transporter periplasmic adaptor subunit [Gilvimarinus agarilyticus]